MSSSTKKSNTSTKPKTASKAKKPEAAAKPKATTAKATPKATKSKAKAAPTEAAVTTTAANWPFEAPAPVTQAEATVPAKSEGDASATGKPDVAAPADPSKRERLIDLDVPTLQSKYLDAVGRGTGSSNKAYLIWKIREAQKGRIPVGPRQSTPREGVVYQTLPLRMEAVLVAKLDEVWRKRGLRSRMDLFRQSLQLYMNTVGETDVAAAFAVTA